MLALLAWSWPRVVVTCAAIVHGSGPPFTFRLGQRPDRELRVNVKEFRIRNQTKTSNERQAAADQVPPVDGQRSRPDPRPGRSARRSDRRPSPRRRRFEDLRETVRTTWKLKPEIFLDIKAATDTPERRDNLHAQIAAAFRPLLRDGVLGPGTLPPQRGIQPDAVDSQRGRAAGLKPGRSPRERVVPERIVKPDGPVYQEFCSAFTTPRIGQILFSLIADQLDSQPTLLFEAEATAKLREAGPKRVARPLRHLHPGRGSGRTGTGHRRGAAHPAAAGARRRRGRASASAIACRRAVGILALVARALRSDRLLRLPA